MMVCLDKRKGDLGIKNPSTFNKALFCKWSGALLLKGKHFGIK